MDFKESGQSNQLTNLFTASALNDVLEEAETHFLDVVFPFQSAIGNACCGHALSLDVTEVCLKYLGMVNDK